MSIAQTNTIAKIAAVVAGLGLVAMSFVSAVPAKAATSDVQSQIAALQAQLAALMAQAGGSTGACTSFMANLTVGSRGADVTALQNLLISKGFSISAGATGFFGAQTKAAVAAWQASAGISPAVGFFGPISRAKVNALGCPTGVGGGTSTGGLTGGAGKLKNIDMLGDVNTDLHEGDSATKVIGFSADAEGSDIGVQRLDVTITIGGTTGSASASKYFDTISVYQDGKKLGSMNASAGDKNGRVWTYRFSDLGGVVKQGSTGNFYVEVTPVSSIGSTESGVTLTAAFITDGIRAIDAEGISETYTPTGTLTQDFTVSTATTGTLTISEASDNPKSSTVKVDTANTTDNITLAAFSMKAKNQDVTIHNLPVGINSGATKLNEYLQSVALVSNGKTIKTKTISSTGTNQTVVFDNIDQSISKDDTQEFSVVATVRKIDSGNTFNSGDYAYATTSAAVDTADWDVEDAQGSTVTPTGSLTGNHITFQATGISVTKTNASYNTTVGSNVGEGDKTQYSISFQVTAGDSDLYISRTITRGSASVTPTLGSGVTWATTTSSNTAVTSSTIATNLSVGDTNSGDTASVYKIPSGTSRTFTLNVTLTATSTGFTGVQLMGFDYGTTTTMGAAYTSGLDTFKTSDVSMAVH